MLVGNGDARGVYGLLALVGCRLVAHNAGVIGSSHGFLLQRGKCLGAAVLSQVVGIGLAVFHVLLALLLLLGRGGGKLAGLDFLVGHLDLAVESDVITMGEEEVLRIVAVPVLREHGGNLFLGILLGVELGVCNVVVSGDTAVFGSFAVVGAAHEVHLIAVADIRRIQGGAEVRIVLTLIVAAGIVVVEVEAHAQTLVGIDTKLGRDVVVAVLLVAAGIVAHIGVGRQGVEKMEVFYLLGDIAVGVGEEKLAGGGAVDEDAVQTRREVVAHRAVLAIAARAVDAVLKKVGHGVERGGGDIAEGAVDGPGPNTLGHLLVGAGGVALVGIEVAILIATGDNAVLVDLIIYLSLHTEGSADGEQQ